MHSLELWFVPVRTWERSPHLGKDWAGLHCAIDTICARCICQTVRSNRSASVEGGWADRGRAGWVWAGQGRVGQVWAKLNTWSRDAYSVQCCIHGILPRIKWILRFLQPSGSISTRTTAFPLIPWPQTTDATETWARNGWYCTCKGQWAGALSTVNKLFSILACLIPEKATLGATGTKSGNFSEKEECFHRISNLGPLAWEAGALPYCCSKTYKLFR